MTKDYNSKLTNLTVTYTHNKKGESVTNVTIVNFINVTKFLAYCTVRVPQNQIDREYKIQLLKTVADVDKILNGYQSNPLARAYVNNIMQFMDFEMKFPLKPVR